MAQCGDKPKRIAFGVAPLGIISIGIVPMGVVSIGVVPMGVLNACVVGMGVLVVGVNVMGVWWAVLEGMGRSVRHLRPRCSGWWSRAPSAASERRGPAQCAPASSSRR